MAARQQRRSCTTQQDKKDNKTGVKRERERRTCVRALCKEKGKGRSHVGVAQAPIIFSMSIDGEKGEGLEN